MLCPTQYIKDMRTIAIFVPNHRLKSEQEIQQYFQFSKKKWKLFSSVDFDYVNDKTQQPKFESRIKYDIKSASSRQKSFYYNVSLPHF
jgi:hypothetical protein